MYPILFKFGPIEIYTYGVFLAIAFYAAVRWSVYKGAEVGYAEDEVLNLAIVSILIAVVGARITYIYVFWERYAANPWEVLQVWKGGLVFYGGLAGGVGAGVAYWYLKGKDVFKMGDVAAMSVSLGQGIGRIGCFFYGCCYGMQIETQSMWYNMGVQFPLLEGVRHATQLYSSIGNFLIFALLIYVFKKAKTPGLTIVTYLIVYGIFRFCIEIVRSDHRGHILGIQSISTSQTVAVLSFLFGILMFFYVNYRRKKYLDLAPDTAA